MRNLGTAIVMLSLVGCGGDHEEQTPADGGVDSSAACSAAGGAQHEQTITVGAETRTYFLYVPEAVRCATGVPLWIDFHGTAGDPDPEEAYANEGAMAEADAEGVILVRPRSRSNVEGGFPIYRWDENTGDVARNVTFVAQLVDHIGEIYAIDRAQIVVSGFSSGANMASQYLRPTTFPVAGIATIGGGFWGVSASELSRVPPHVYSMTGYRDYMRANFEPLRDLYKAAGLDQTRWYSREANIGHELYDWHFGEFLPWLLHGDRKPADVPAAAWADESIATQSSLLTLLSTPTGIVAGGSGGATFRRDASGWSALGVIPAAAHAVEGIHITSLCSTGSKLYAAAQTALYSSTNDGATWTALPAVPEPEATYFGVAWLTAIDCGVDRSLLGAGLWVGVESTDDAASWHAAPLESGTYQASIASLARNANGTVIAAGLGYAGRRTAGGSFQQLFLPGVAQWWTGVTSVGDSFWAVGDTGSIVRSSDDGQTWTHATSPVTEDFYAVAFADAQTGAAVGAHGAVVITHDGGATWTDVSIGKDVFLGAALWPDPHTLLVAGEHGTVERLSI
ncbi:MAG TPA: hypothetical protein VGM90_06815 [Kofleriaceae bacterium]|jgi:photosystem II stability/assembly factor-like uncharacterized protein/predicted esterase